LINLSTFVDILTYFWVKDNKFIKIAKNPMIDENRIMTGYQILIELLIQKSPLKSGLFVLVRFA